MYFILLLMTKIEYRTWKHRGEGGEHRRKSLTGSYPVCAREHVGKNTCTHDRAAVLIGKKKKKDRMTERVHYIVLRT